MSSVFEGAMISDRDLSRIEGNRVLGVVEKLAQCLTDVTAKLWPEAGKK